MYCVVYSVYCLVYTVYCVVYSVYCVVYSVLCTYYPAFVFVAIGTTTRSDQTQSPGTMHSELERFI